MKTCESLLILNIIKKNMFFKSCEFLGSKYNFEEATTNPIHIKIPGNIFENSKKNRLPNLN